ncbi:MAG: hypothetical protein DLM64_10540 [Solirubrobacterales bacterium]|nr:MAG: hypothetical protein DLM64_10540 [Solirubrobacterales bacterium]
MILDPTAKTIEWLLLGDDGRYHRVAGSHLIDLDASELATGRSRANGRCQVSRGSPRNDADGLSATRRMS